MEVVENRLGAYEEADLYGEEDDAEVNLVNGKFMSSFPVPSCVLLFFSI